ncbi:Homeodomain-like superfamily protein [Zea mays]|uniref:Homeodomain-like superfamily protein n=1 Tax=Zea mays TaxID=4577 RepID=A0A1D6HF71_MAIZE|nr:Homeodomain-like superfamily protein [Zea mays]
MPPDYHCKDKFLVQSIAVEEGTTQKDIVPDMFSKAPGKLVEEFKLRVVYVPANPPSPVPEETEEEDGSLDSDVDHEVSTSNSATGQGNTCRSQTSDDEVSLVPPKYHLSLCSLRFINMDLVLITCCIAYYLKRTDLTSVFMEILCSKNSQ